MTTPPAAPAPPPAALTPHPIADLIRRWRELHGWKVETAASLIGVGPSYYRRAEDGTTVPHSRILRGWARRLGLPPEAIAAADPDRDLPAGAIRLADGTVVNVANDPAPAYTARDPFRLAGHGFAPLWPR